MNLHPMRNSFLEFSPSVELHANPKAIDFAISAAAQASKPLDSSIRANGPIQVVDLFCGAGGLSTGFEIVGRMTPSYRLVGAIDVDVQATRTYHHNLGLQPLVADLAGLNANPSDCEKLIKQLGVRRDRPLVVIGGPPCQGFSAHRKKSRDPEDGRNELIESFTALVLALNPDFIAFENVPEVTAKKYWARFEAMCETFVSHGYMVNFEIHNLAEFSVPQERFRALMLAGRRKFRMPRPFLERRNFMSVRDAIGHLPFVEAGQLDVDDPMHVSSRHRSETIETIKQVPLNGGSRPAGVGPRCLQVVDGFRDVYGRLHWDRPANTITAYARNPASGRFTHPEQHRGLTVREAALLQGFPPNFEFLGPFDDRFSQIGNAVPPKFAAFLAAHIFGELTSEDDAVPEVEFKRIPSSNSFSSGLAGRKRK